MRVCIVGASGKLGQYMVQHALDRGYEVVGVCREQSVEKLDAFKERITVVPGATDERDVIKQAVAGCAGVLVVLVPRGVHDYSSGTAQAVLDHAQPGARLVFSSGWHITRDGQDVYSWKLRLFLKVVTPLARLVRFADIDDQVEACRRVFSSDTRWTVVRGSDLDREQVTALRPTRSWWPRGSAARISARARSNRRTGTIEEDGAWRRSPSAKRSRSIERTPRAVRQWCSYTACGCCPAAGIAGQRSSRRRATPR
jgi:NAD(P)H-binding